MKDPGISGETTREGSVSPTWALPDLSRETEESTTRLAWSLLQRPAGTDANRRRFLNLMKLSVLDLLYESNPQWRRYAVEGWDWPQRAATMIGLRRLNNIEDCFDHVVLNNIPGDFIETGVWRGGAAIFMRALLASYDITDRVVWAADSFSGLPVPNRDKYPADTSLDFSDVDLTRLSVSLEETKANFRRYGLLDDQVRFLEGWFRNSLPSAPIERLAILRLDADLYESTMDALVHLYPKVSAGGCVIIDDNWIPACRQAVDDYRESHHLSEQILQIDSQGAYWIKAR